MNFRELSPNKKRAARLSFLRRENLRMAEDLESYLSAGNFSTAQTEWAEKLIGNLRGCMSHSLFREFVGDKALGFVGGHSCKQKLCNVCNSERKRGLRRRYYNYFEEREELLSSTDPMHLTLTVPHQNGEWKGKRFYEQELTNAFKIARSYKWWKVLVWGGEYSVEFTKGENGLHIHIHALVLAYRSKGSRNKLHSKILKTWNTQTVDPDYSRVKFSSEEVEGISKGLKYMEVEKGPTVLENYINNLNPQGSTFIGLESLYVLSEKKRPGYFFDQRSGKYKRYVRGNDPADLLQGVMECLKYHFEPFSLKLGEGRDAFYDLDLIMDLGPKLFRRRLLQKFGGLHGEKQLNLSSVTAAEDLEAYIEDAEGGNIVVHPESGDIADRAEYSYMMADLSKAYIDGKERLSLSGPMLPIHAPSARSALIQMVQIFINSKTLKFDGKNHNHGNH